MTEQIVRINVNDFSDKELIGRTEREIKLFAQDLLVNGSVLYPVMATTLGKKPYVLDGVKRIMASRWIVENIDDGREKEFETIKTIMLDKLPPADRATISIISNEQRSDNPIASYRHMKQLKDKGKWLAVAELFKLNPGTFKKLSTLDNLIDQDYFFEQAEESNLAIGTLFKIAKEGKPRQKICLAKLKAGQKVTGNDLRDIRSVEANKVLAGLDLNLNVPTVARTQDLFVYINGKKPSKVYESVADAMGANEKGVLYRLVPMGSK